MFHIRFSCRQHVSMRVESMHVLCVCVVLCVLHMPVMTDYTDSMEILNWIRIVNLESEDNVIRQVHASFPTEKRPYSEIFEKYQQDNSKTKCFPNCDLSGMDRHKNGRTDILPEESLGNAGVNTTETVTRQKRTIVGGFPFCPRGCASCSAVNGCVTCERRYFLFLYRRNMRQTGMCTQSCPPGYYGHRHRQYSRCNRCQVEHCQTCFSRRYCTRCYPPRVSHRGACLDACPPGMHFANYSSECRETVDCLAGPWGSWSKCSARARGCQQRVGVKVRSRVILESPSPDGTPCPILHERRVCHARAACRDVCRKRKRHKKKRKRGRNRKWKKRGRGRHRKRQKYRRARCKKSKRCRRRCAEDA